LTWDSFDVPLIFRGFVVERIQQAVNAKASLQRVIYPELQLRCVPQRQRGTEFVAKEAGSMPEACQGLFDVLIVAQNAHIDVGHTQVWADFYVSDGHKPEARIMCPLLNE
jgi:hypothetical protein